MCKTKKQMVQKSKNYAKVVVPQSLQTKEMQTSLYRYHSGEDVCNYINEPSRMDAPEEKWCIGMEVEKYDYAYSKSTKEDLKELGWLLEKDSSVKFELVSPTFNLFNDCIFGHIDALHEFIDVDNLYDCGGHLHISRKGFTPIELLNQFKGLLPLIYAMHRNRLRNGFCLAKKVEALISDQHKYQSVKLHNNRIEFRIISAVKNTIQLKWRVQLFREFAYYMDVPFSQILVMLLTKKNSLTNHIKIVYNTPEKLAKLCEAAIDINTEFGSEVLTQKSIESITKTLSEIKNNSIEEA